MLSRCRLIAVLVCTSLWCVAAESRKERDRKEPPVVPPPQPIPQEMKVQRGQEIIIPLRIYGRKNQVLTFLIRKLPRTGRLSGLKNTEAEAAIVHYRPTDDHSITRDVFEYAVKSVEGVSAAVPVSIEILDEPPELAGPAEVFFPPRLTGTTETQTIELVNRGGQTAEGECRVEAPWRLESAEKYRVEPNGRLFVKVTFAPDKAGDFLGELRLTSQPERAVVLKGSAREALFVNPSPLRLGIEPTTLVRAGAFELTNNTDEEQLVRVQLPDRLLAEREIAVKPGQTVPVMVRTIPEDADALNVEVTLQAGEYRAVVAVTADPLPAVVRPVDRLLDFGLIPAGTLPQKELTLRNVGGAAGTATVSAQPPIRVSSRPISLAPGATVSVPVHLEATEIGTFDAALQLRVGNNTQQVPVRAVVVAPGITPPRHGQRMASASRAEQAAMTPLPTSVHDLEYHGAVESKRIVRTVLLEPDRCTFEWHTDLSSAPGFVAEKRELSLQSGQLAVKWERLPPLRIERPREHVRATLEGLQPGKRHTVRILSLDRDGNVSGLVAQTAVTTPSPRAFRFRISWFGFLSTAAVVLVALSLWRRLQPASRGSVAMKKTQRLKKTQRIA